jgi:hypothetical protein
MRIFGTPWGREQHLSRQAHVQVSARGQAFRTTDLKGVLISQHGGAEVPRRSSATRAFAERPSCCCSQGCGFTLQHSSCSKAAFPKGYQVFPCASPLAHHARGAQGAAWQQLLLSVQHWIHAAGLHPPSFKVQQCEAVLRTEQGTHQFHQDKVQGAEHLLHEVRTAQDARCY